MALVIDERHTVGYLLLKYGFRIRHGMFSLARSTPSRRQEERKEYDEAFMRFIVDAVWDLARTMPGSGEGRS